MPAGIVTIQILFRWLHFWDSLGRVSQRTAWVSDSYGLSAYSSKLFLEPLGVGVVLQIIHCGWTPWSFVLFMLQQLWISVMVSICRKKKLLTAVCNSSRRSDAPFWPPMLCDVVRIVHVCKTPIHAKKWINPRGGKVFASGHIKCLPPPHVASEVSGSSGEGEQEGVTGSVTHTPLVSALSRPNHKGFWDSQSTVCLLTYSCYMAVLFLSQ